MSCSNKDEIETHLCLWRALTEQYCNQYAEEKLNDSYPSPTGSTATMYNLQLKAEDILRYEAKLLGTSISNSKNIKAARNKLKNLKTRYEERGKNLNKYINLNQANNPRKVDTLDKKSRAYLTTSFYTISILTMSFFIYKQLKE
jgi:hypothetical protein